MKTTIFISSVQKELAGVRTPLFHQSGGQFVQTLWRPRAVGTDPVDRPSRPTQSAPQMADPVIRLLSALDAGELSPQALRRAVAITHRQTFRMNYLQPALRMGLVERTVPDTPTSRLQRYRITAKGRKRLAGGMT